MNRAQGLLGYAVNRTEAPLSFEQEWMFRLSRMRPAGTLNLPRLYQLAPGAGADRAAGALNALVRRHDLLRTRFERRDGGFVQVVGDDPPGAEILKVSAAGHDAARAQALGLAGDFVSDALDPSRGRLFRYAIAPLPDGSQFLATVIHHTVADAVTLDVLDGLIRAEIAGGARDDASGNLAVAGYSYADYAAWQHDTYDPRLSADLAGYAAALQGTGPAVLPSVAPPPGPAGPGRSASTDLASVDAGALQRLLTDERASLFMGGLTALGLALRSISKRSGFVVGIEVSTRSAGPLRTALGLFTNTVPVAVRVPDGASFRAGLRVTRDIALHAFGRAHLPYNRVIGRPELRSLRQRNDLAVGIVYQTFHERAGEAAGEIGGQVTRVPFQLAGAGATADLHISLHQAPAGLQLMIGYSTRVPGGVAEDLADRFETALRHGALDPDRPMA